MTAAMLLLIWSLSAATADAPAAALGQRLHDAMQRQGQLIDSPEAAAWCRSLLPPQPAGQIEIHFTVDERPRAFALPGGRIYLSAGMFLALQNSDQLAFVLAHEAAHVHLGERSDQMHSSDKLAVEMAVDRAAIAAMQRLGRNPGEARAALDRLASFGQSISGAAVVDGLQQRLDALPMSSGDLPVSNLDPSVAALQVQALAAFLDRAAMPADWQFAQQCLATDCALVLTPPDRLRLQAETWRRQGRFQDAADAFMTLLTLEPAEPRVRRGLALSLEAVGRGDAAAVHWQWLVDAGAADADVIAVAVFEGLRRDSTPLIATGWGGRKHRFDGLMINLDRPWRRVASARGTLKLSRDGPGIQWLGIRTVERPIESSPRLELDRWLAEIRAARTSHDLTLVSASPWPATRPHSGLSVVLEYKDAVGLGWRLALYRMNVAGRIVEAEFKAPRLHFFARDIVTVAAALATLRAAADSSERGGPGSATSGHDPEPLLQP